MKTWHGKLQLPLIAIDWDEGPKVPGE